MIPFHYEMVVWVAGRSDATRRHPSPHLLPICPIGCSVAVRRESFTNQSLDLDRVRAPYTGFRERVKRRTSSGVGIHTPVPWTTVKDRRVSGAPRRSWLQRLGLQEPPPDPDAWVEVASFRIDSDQGSRSAARAVATLGRAGIEAQQRPYVLPDPGTAVLVSGAPDPVERIRVAVLVRNGDRHHATELLQAGQ
jgi:hypothetical protein